MGLFFPHPGRGESTVVESLELNPSPSHSPAGWPLATAFTSLNLGFFGSQGWQSHPPHRGVVRERWSGTPFRTRRACWVCKRGDAVDTLGACFARGPSQRFPRPLLPTAPPAPRPLCCHPTPACPSEAQHARAVLQQAWNKTLPEALWSCPLAAPGRAIPAP